MILAVVRTFAFFPSVSLLSSSSELASVTARVYLRLDSLRVHHAADDNLLAPCFSTQQQRRMSFRRFCTFAMRTSHTPLPVCRAQIVHTDRRPPASPVAAAPCCEVRTRAISSIIFRVVAVVVVVVVVLHERVLIEMKMPPACGATLSTNGADDFM